jgi:multimeric flavodoxin WrbA
MKVLLVNGSPNEHKCTYTALQQVEQGLALRGIECEWFQVGQQARRPCVACGGCNTTQRCAFGNDDGVNELIERMQAADGIVLGSPVFYAGINGSLKSMLDRAFFAAASTFALKPGGTVVSARRGGTTAALEQLNKYFIISQMPVIGSLYWPMVHGQQPEEVLQDKEGCQCAWQLGANMGWLLECMAAGRAAGIEPTPVIDRAWTNFIR